MPKPRKVNHDLALFEDEKACFFALPPTIEYRKVRVVNSDNAIEEDALRALGDLMSREDKANYEVILASVPSVAQRIASWRARRLFWTTQA